MAVHRGEVGRPWWRGLKLLVGSSPGASAGIVLIQVLDGSSRPIVLAAGATLLDQAPLSAQSPDASQATMTALAVIAVALVVSSTSEAFLSTFSTLLGYRFETAVDRLRMEAAGALPGLAQFDSAELADRLQAGQGAASARQLVSLGFTLRWLTTAVGSGVVASRLGWWAPLLVAAGSVPSLVNNWRHVGTQTGLLLEHMEANRHADYHYQLAVGLSAAREVRLFGLGDWLLGRQRRSWSEASAPVFADMRRQLHQNLLISGTAMALAAVPFVVAFRRLADGSLSPGSFSAVVLALGIMMSALRFLESSPAMLRSAGRFFPELFALVDLPSTDPRMETNGHLMPPAYLDDGIRFEDVTFTYPGTERPVLEGLDLWLPARSSLALVGENGSGKSTLVKLLCRFYDPDRGRITVDGIDLRDLDLTSLRRRFGVVFQDFTRWPLPVIDNVGVGTPKRMADQDLLIDAAEQSGALEVIDRLPDGWDTVLARQFGGVDLSGGEWQRIALARAVADRLSGGASVLVLDEPTAALDVRLEHDLFQRFDSLTEGLTTLLISHRFSTVRMADQVAVMEGGRIVELGSHTELMVADGRYSELYSLQAQRFQRGSPGVEQDG